MGKGCWVLGSSLAALAAGACSAPSAAPPRRPNIVFILSDDHAVHAIGAYGSALARTPNIDRLASEGVRFERAFCGNAICAPARATLLTGVHSHVHGVVDNAARFDGSQPTFPMALQQAGYATALVGKWHLKSEPTGFGHW
jgi:arylsulfatase A-like enzyme